MKKIFLESWLIFVISFGPVLIPVPVLANKGVVNCSIEWGSNRQTYTFVFSGTVSKEGRPCPNAKIQLQLSAANQPDQIQETLAGADGSYELKVSMSGTADQAAQWKLVALAPEASALEATEIEGSAIPTDDGNTVMVQRPIQLVQG
jgi:hypothetical protein